MKTRTTISIDERLLERVKDEADALNISVSAWISLQLSDVLRSAPKPAEKPTNYEDEERAG